MMATSDSNVRRYQGLTSISMVALGRHIPANVEVISSASMCLSLVFEVQQKLLTVHDQLTSLWHVLSKKFLMEILMGQ